MATKKAAAKKTATKAAAPVKAAYPMIMGFEVMRALRKGQAALFNLTQEIRGEACIVERAFGIGLSALAEAIEVFDERLIKFQPA